MFTNAQDIYDIIRMHKKKTKYSISGNISGPGVPLVSLGHSVDVTRPDQEYIAPKLNLSSSATNHYRVKKIGIIMSNHYVYEIVIFFFSWHGSTSQNFVLNWSCLSKTKVI